MGAEPVQVNAYATLLIGVICAGVGGELFVRGAVGLARWARIPAGIVAATVAAFATSSPELSVSLSAAFAGAPQIALGDALGSNVVNIALILAVTLTISGIRVQRSSLRRDYPVALLSPLVIAALLFDGELSRLDGVLLLAFFLTWLNLTVAEARKHRSVAGGEAGEPRGWRTLLLCVIGLFFLISAGNLVVSGARGIAAALGLGEFVIGALVVSAGTSMPELATAIVAKLRGHDDIGLGALLGSNIFNGLFIVALAAIIHPIVVPWRDAVPALLFGMGALMLAYPARTGVIGPARGVMLLLLYVAYLFTILRTG